MQQNKHRSRTQKNTEQTQKKQNTENTITIYKGTVETEGKDSVEEESKDQFFLVANTLPFHTEPQISSHHHHHHPHSTGL